MDMEATLMVGMEVHVELATRTKMFTSAANVAHREFEDAPPNSLCDPVVLGLPGALPVINRRAVEMAMRVGLALNCQIARFTKWDRKSYYYPDLPKNYQISQYDHPLCGAGALEIALADGTKRTVRIRRAHLEEDAGKLLHEAPGGGAIEHSIVDLNRAGTPLLEIVTEPDLRSAEEAVVFAQTLRDICRFLGVTRGVMQKGHIRFEPNINVVIRQGGKEYRTPIVEVKNLNSFRAVQGAIEHEFTRQVEEWQQTGKVMGQRAKTTRGWDDVRNQTTLQRTKEDADEYRYFPDPDLVPVVVDEAWLSRVRGELKELPGAKHERYTGTLGLGVKDARQLLEEPELAGLFDEVVSLGVEARRACSLLLNNLAKRANEKGVGAHELGVSAAQIRGVAELLSAEKLGSGSVDALLGQCAEHPGEDAATLAERFGLLQVCDTGALDAMVDQVLADAKNARAVADLRAGKDKAIGALMGQVMKLSRGQANAKMVQDLIRAKVSGA